MNVLSMYISNMKQTGEIDKLWMEALSSGKDVTCSLDNTPVESNDQLKMVHLAGIFVVFGVCFGASVLLHFSHFWTLSLHNKFQAQKTSTSKLPETLAKELCSIDNEGKELWDEREEAVRF